MTESIAKAYLKHVFYNKIWYNTALLQLVFPVTSESVVVEAFSLTAQDAEYSAAICKCVHICYIGMVHSVAYNRNYYLLMTKPYLQIRCLVFLKKYVPSDCRVLGNRTITPVFQFSHLPGRSGQVTCFSLQFHFLLVTTLQYRLAKKRYGYDYLQLAVLQPNFIFLFLSCFAPDILLFRQQ